MKLMIFAYLFFVPLAFVLGAWWGSLVRRTDENRTKALAKALHSVFVEKVQHKLPSLPNWTPGPAFEGYHDCACCPVVIPKEQLLCQKCSQEAFPKGEEPTAWNCEKGDLP